MTLNFVLDASTSGSEVLRGQVVFEGQGWVAFAVSPTGTMVGSTAVIGIPGQEPAAQLYNLGGYSTAMVTLADDQGPLLSGQCSQNDTHTVLDFQLAVNADATFISFNAQGETNNVLLAAGQANTLDYHGPTNRGALQVTATACTGTGTSTGQSQSQSGPDFAVGDEISVEGFIMDNFCIERGTLLDAPSIMTLEQPNLHSLHCLLDVPQCVGSNYEILLDPLPGQTMYRRGMTLDGASKQMVIDMAQELGTCDTCTGGRLRHGFRANMTATVLDMGDSTTGAPPMVAVSDVQPVLFITDASTEATLQVGDRVTVTGFIMDNFCIERGKSCTSQFYCLRLETSRLSICLSPRLSIYKYCRHTVGCSFGCHSPKSRTTQCSLFGRRPAMRSKRL